MKPDGAGGVIILIGPTGVGKTEVAFNLAELAEGEIISADSRQVYRGMDIGTAKPSRRMRKEVPHHMIDVVDPDEKYTCKMFEQEGRRVIAGIIKRGRVPIVVGGTGLYVRALTDGIFEGPGRDEGLRAELEARAEDEGKHALWEHLRSVDPEKARGTNTENLARVIRALEVYELTGRRMSDLEKQTVPLGIPCFKVGLTRARIELYEIIDRRVDTMLEVGLVEEVESLVRKGWGKTTALRDSLGYREISSYLEGAITYREAVRLIKSNTRRFAKRQLTWFRKEKDVTWFNITGRTDFAPIAREILPAISQ